MGAPKKRGRLGAHWLVGGEFPLVYSRAHLDSLSNEELALRAVALYVVAEAEARGLAADALSESAMASLAALLLARLPKMEAYGARNAAVEKALHKTIAGDLETAGRLLREHLIDGARALQAETYAREAHDVRSKGGIKSKKSPKRGQRATELDERNTKIRARRDELIAKGHRPQDCTGILARQYNLTPTWVRQIVGQRQEKGNSR